MDNVQVVDQAHVGKNVLARLVAFLERGRMGEIWGGSSAGLMMVEDGGSSARG